MAAGPEQHDVTVGSYLHALARRWWVIVGFVVLGMAVGAVYTLAQPTTYDGTASVYIGQTTDANGDPIASLSSNARAATQLLASDAVLQEAAKKAGMTARQLRDEVSVETPSQVVKTTQSIVNLVVIAVRDTSAKRGAAAANALADALLAKLTPTTQQKIDLLQKQVDTLQNGIDQSNQKADAATEALDAIAKGGGTKAEKAVAAAAYIAVVQAAATDRSSLEVALQRAQLLLLTAQNVEQPRLLHEAVPPQTPSGPDMALNVAAGALAGFVIGIITALALERRRLATA
jgi:uncharacterized protein involved in exopolysaccharide biosynthesis